MSRQAANSAFHKSKTLDNKYVSQFHYSIYFPGNFFSFNSFSSFSLSAENGLIGCRIEGIKIMEMENMMFFFVNLLSNFIFRKMKIIFLIFFNSFDYWMQIRFLLVGNKLEGKEREYNTLFNFYFSSSDIFSFFLFIIYCTSRAYS